MMNGCSPDKGQDDEELHCTTLCYVLFSFVLGETE
uniref:Uncharacterized protein n=1 Tax=Manihot esculenta TaxID=3983 RepID=A0A2C9W8G6_MANES